jgi:hypothetical protein
VEYSGAASGPGTHRAELRIVFDKPVELVGHMAAKLFMSAPMTTDMDVFVAVWKLDKEGNPVPFAYYAQYEDGPVSPSPRGGNRLRGRWRWDGFVRVIGSWIRRRVQSICHG